VSLKKTLAIAGIVSLWLCTRCVSTLKLNGMDSLQCLSMR
jgi:hypothetical protein